MSAPTRLAIVVSHPIQYYAPWFRHLAARPGLAVRAFYLWNFGVTAQRDAGFGHVLQWDIPLLEGYASEFVPNSSARPGTESFMGLRNPTLAARLRAWSPDAVLVFGYGHFSLLRLLLTWSAHRAPLLFRGDSHLLGRPPATWRRRVHAAIAGRALRRCAACLSPGAAHRDFLLAHGVAPARIHHVPHCIDNARFARTPEIEAEARAWRNELGIPPEHRVVLFAGKLEPKKRPDLLLASFLAARPSNAALLLVGHGPLETELKRTAASHREVKFAPFQNQRAMPRTYAAADLLALPSEGHRETWGLAVNEAMAAGIPALVSDQVGCRADLVSEGETGWSFPAGDGAALAAALARALTTLADPQAAATVRAHLSQRIARYSYDAATAGALTALAACTANATLAAVAH
jgi:glycosyltransferase involved in cell wall biosynthesis